MLAFGAFLGSAGVCFVLIALLFPYAQRYALPLSKVHASNHATKPHGGGIAVIGATLFISVIALVSVLGAFGLDTVFGTLAAATIALTLLGALDDIRTLKIVTRLAVQAVCVTAVVLVAAGEKQILGEGFPPYLERFLAISMGIWFVNLSNFMDGLDWMTVAAITPISGAVAVFGAAGVVDTQTMVLAAALSGGLIAFAPFNKPIAKLILGDSGSLPIGLIVASLLYSLANSGALVAAVILPLYYCSDTTITLFRRIIRKEQFWEAHQTHFYHRATKNGLSVLSVVAHVFVLNCLLALLAAASIRWQSTAVDICACTLSVLMVAGTLYHFSVPRCRADY